MLSEMSFSMRYLNNATANNGSNVTYSSLRDVYETFCGPVWLQMAYLVVYTPVSAIGFFLSVLCVFLFFQSEFKLPLYDYLKLYSISNVIVCFASFFYTFTWSAEVFPFANTYISKFYASYIFTPVVNVSYYFSTALDIIITMDRIALFVPKVKAINKINAFKLSAITFLICFAIDFPYFLTFEPNKLIIPLNSTYNFTFYINDLTPYAVTQAAQIISNIQFAVRDIIPVFSLVALNIASIVLLKLHLRKKAKLVKKKKVGDISSSSNTGDEANKKAKTSNADVKATIMVILISVLTAIQNFLLIAVLLYYRVTLFGFAGILLVFLVDFFYPFKCMCAFFIFYYFNNNFRKDFRVKVLRFKN